MATKLLLIISLLLSGCAASLSQNSVVGNYYTKGKNYSYSLQLNTDSTFQLIIQDMEVKSSCDGTWRMVGDDTILLKCFPPNPSEQLQGGYMSNRERKIAVLNNRKLRIDNLVLKSSN